MANSVWRQQWIILRLVGRYEASEIPLNGMGEYKFMGHKYRFYKRNPCKKIENSHSLERNSPGSGELGRNFDTVSKFIYL